MVDFRDPVRHKTGIQNAPWLQRRKREDQPPVQEHFGELPESFVLKKVGASENIIPDALTLALSVVITAG